MCRRGVQRLTEDEVLDLLDKARVEYPNVRAIRRREPQAFLELLEARSSILIKSGGSWSANQPKERPVWEFRHLTFQEYLAAWALLHGRYPDRDKTRSLAEQVAPLAGTVQELQYKPGSEPELQVTESWRETLRLLVADCKDDDVDDVLLAILTPQTGEDATKTARPRAVLAALCLADEPNVSEDIARHVLIVFAEQVSENDGNIISLLGERSALLDKAAVEIGRSMWAPQLKTCLMDEFKNRPSDLHRICGLWTMAEIVSKNKPNTNREAWLLELVQRLRSDDPYEALFSAWVVRGAAFKAMIDNETFQASGLIEALLKLLQSGQPYCFIAAHALDLLSNSIYYSQITINGEPIWRSIRQEPSWQPNAAEVALISRVLSKVSFDKSQINTRRWLVRILENCRDPQVIEPLLQQLDDIDKEICISEAVALGLLGLDW